MTARIISSWIVGGSITPYDDIWTVEQWIAEAELDYKIALSSDPPDTAYPIVTTWKSGGTPHSVSTTQNAGETVEHWVARHFDAVKARMKQYPPDTN